MDSYILLDRVVIQSYDYSSGFFHKSLSPSAVRINLMYIHEISNQ